MHPLQIQYKEQTWQSEFPKSATFTQIGFSALKHFSISPRNLYKHVIVFKATPLDFLLTLEDSKLPKNSLLHIVKIKSKYIPEIIQLAIQIPQNLGQKGSNKVKLDVPANSTLFNVLRVAETEFGVNLTHRYIMPATMVIVKKTLGQPIPGKYKKILQKVTSKTPSSVQASFLQMGEPATMTPTSDEPLWILPSIGFLQNSTTSAEQLMTQSLESLGLTSGRGLIRVSLGPSDIPLTQIDKVLFKLRISHNKKLKKLYQKMVKSNSKLDTVESAPLVMNHTLLTGFPPPSSSSYATPPQPTTKTTTPAKNGATNGATNQTGPLSNNIFAAAINTPKSSLESNNSSKLPENHLDSNQTHIIKHPENFKKPGPAAKITPAFNPYKPQFSNVESGTSRVGGERSIISLAIEQQHGITVDIGSPSQSKPKNNLHKKIERNLKCIYQVTSTKKNATIDTSWHSSMDDELESDDSLWKRAMAKIFLENDEKTLKTSAMRKQKAVRLYSKTVVRIRFPPRFINNPEETTSLETKIQAEFHPDEPLSHLYSFVAKKVLKNPTIPFHLYITPPLLILPNINSKGEVPPPFVPIMKRFRLTMMNKTFADFDLVPASVINILPGYDPKLPVSSELASIFESDTSLFQESILKIRETTSSPIPVEIPKSYGTLYRYHAPTVEGKSPISSASSKSSSKSLPNSSNTKASTLQSKPKAPSTTSSTDAPPSADQVKQKQKENKMLKFLGRRK